MASLLSLSLLSLISTIPLAAAAPAKQQLGARGYGRPNFQVGPPWFGGPRWGPSDTDDSPDTPQIISTTIVSTTPDTPAAIPAQTEDPTINNDSDNNIPANPSQAPPIASTVPLSVPPPATIAPTPSSFLDTIELTATTDPLTEAAASNAPAQFFPSTQAQQQQPSLGPAVSNTAPPSIAPANPVPSTLLPDNDAPSNTNANTLPAPTLAASNTLPLPPAASTADDDTPNPPAATAATPIPLSPSNTLNGTFPDNSPPATPPSSNPGLDVELVNNFGSSTISVYVTAQDESGRVMLLTPDQTWHYPSADSDAVPQPVGVDVAIPLGAVGATTRLNLPGFFASGRIYFSTTPLQFSTLINPLGVTLVAPDPFNPSDPAATALWSFVEMTYSSIAGLFANLSFVDFLGLPVGMSLSTTSGAQQTVLGTTPDSMASVCAALAQKAAEENEPGWGKLCEYSSSSSSSSSSGVFSTDANANTTADTDTGTSSPPTDTNSAQQQILRVDAPGKYIAARDPTAFATYWDAYVTAVWAKYATEPLYVDAQNEVGVVECSTASGLLTCAGGSRPLPAPLSTTIPSAALAIFTCSGPFSTQASDNAVDLALLPRICAALNRSTFLLDGGNYQPSEPVGVESYYLSGPTNWYAQAVHAAERDGRGYAFAYDDVGVVGGKDVSGTVMAGVGDVVAWRVEVGGTA